MEKKKDIIKEIANLINKIENLSLSPISYTQESSDKKKEDLINLIKRIVMKFDKILNEKIRIDLTKKIKNQSNQDNHYWCYLSKYYQIPSVKFCSFSDQAKNNDARGKLWIFLSIVEKSFNESINEIYNQKFENKFYDKTALIVLKKDEILELCKRLNNIYIPEVSLNDDYLRYKKKLEEEKKNESVENADLDFLKESNEIKEMPEEQENPVNYYINKEILGENNLVSSNFGNMNSIVANNVVNPLLLSIDDTEVIGSFINTSSDKGKPENAFNEEENNNNAFPIKKSENMNGDINNPYYFNSNYIFNQIKNVNNQAPPLARILTSKSSEKNIGFNIKKYSDFQSCYKDNFFNFKKDKVELDEDTNQKFNLNLNPIKKSYYPLDKHFKIIQKTNRNVFSKKDRILFDNREIKITNSVLFYLNNYYRKANYIKFKAKKKHLNPSTIESQNYQCYLCKKKFSLVFGIPTEKIYWCSFYLKFICSNCVDENYSVLPEFILKNWNFKKFSISKQAKLLLEQWKDKPVIRFKTNDILLRRQEKLREVLLIKRKIHKIFDLMKCDKFQDITKNILKERMYLVLHENFLTIQDLVEIYENTLIPKLNTYFEKMKEHILNDCQICHYTGGKCLMCNSNEIIYGFDVENVIYCDNCKKVFHRKCCTVHPCIVER